MVFIAEIYEVGLYRPYIDAGFDYLYDKVNLYDTLRAVETGHVSAAAITSCWQTVGDIMPHMLNFLSGTVRMIDALLVFVYIAIGVGSALAFYNRIAGGLLL